MKACLIKANTKNVKANLSRRVVGAGRAPTNLHANRVAKTQKAPNSAASIRLSADEEAVFGPINTRTSALSEAGAKNTGTKGAQRLTVQNMIIAPTHNMHQEKSGPNLPYAGAPAVRLERPSPASTTTKNPATMPNANRSPLTIFSRTVRLS
jgi:hypothetical protein